MKKLILHDWPGNISELENCIERAVLLSKGDVINEAHIKFSDILFPDIIAEEEDLNIENFEKKLIIKALRESKTVKEAIRKLKMKRSTFYYKILKYGIKPKNLIGLDL